MNTCSPNSSLTLANKSPIYPHLVGQSVFPSAGLKHRPDVRKGNNAVVEPIPITEFQQMVGSKMVISSLEDELLKSREKVTEDGKTRRSSLWRPGCGRHVDEGKHPYTPFSFVSRVLHLDDAVGSLREGRMTPRPLHTFSTLDTRELPEDHPCKDIKVLWFGTKSEEENDQSTSWYGNVEFAVDTKLLTRWKNCYLVEMMTTSTHTASRILLTNKNYSSVLPRYSPKQPGGPWHVTPQAHLTLTQCSRYGFRGTNCHDHVLEFLIEATFEDEKALLQASRISFKNHERARDMSKPHVCSRYQKINTSCPFPYTPTEGANMFFKRILHVSSPWLKIAPVLSHSAEKQKYWFLEDERRKTMVNGLSMNYLPDIKVYPNQ